MNANIPTWQERLNYPLNKLGPAQCIEAEVRDLRAALAAQTVSALADADEDAYLIDRLGKLLAGVAVALKGPEPALTRWSYHDLPEIAEKLMLELELYRAMAVPAVQQGGEAAAQICDRLALMMESGAGEREPGARLRQAARMIRELKPAAAHPVMDDKSGEVKS